MQKKRLLDCNASTFDERKTYICIENDKNKKSCFITKKKLNNVLYVCVFYFKSSSFPSSFFISTVLGGVEL